MTADPTVVADPERDRLALTALLDVPVDELTERAVAEDSRYVDPGRARCIPEVTDAIEELELPGICFEDDPSAALPGRRGRRPGRRLRRPRGHRAGRHRADLRGRARRYARRAPRRGGQRRQPDPVRHRRVHARRRRQHRAASPSTRTCSTSPSSGWREACADGATTRASAVVLDVRDRRGTWRWAPARATTPATTRRPTPELLGNPTVSDVFEPGSVMKAVTLVGRARGGRRRRRTRCSA